MSDLLPKLCQSLIPSKGITLNYSAELQSEESPEQLQLSSLKSKWLLISWLYIASKTHSGDLDEFFIDENQGYPPSLSHLGVLRPRTK